jgi:cleavage stimulation factor subunit 3
MTDLSPSKVQAVSVLRGLQKHLSLLYPPPPASSASRPSLYLPPLPTFTAGERALVGLWKTYLKWEESNPLEIEDKDKTTLIARVQGVYRRSLIRMRFYSEIWYVVAMTVKDYDDTLLAGIWRTFGQAAWESKMKLCTS